uniref:Candidate secreted effector n=1 Tax=Meloidogyne incognita TaxID=6306 RepID=A0A914P435_MELIC
MFSPSLFIASGLRPSPVSFSPPFHCFGPAALAIRCGMGFKLGPSALASCFLCLLLLLCFSDGLKARAFGPR